MSGGGLEDRQYSNPGTHDSGPELPDSLHQTALQYSKSHSPNKSGFLRPIDNQIKAFSPDKMAH